MLNQIRAVVFDLDNTLVSSSLNFAAIRAEIGCDKSADLLEFIEALPPQQQDLASQKVLDHELADAASSQVLEGCHQLLATIESLQLKTAIITRNCKQAAHTKLARSDINIPTVITREDFPAKPEPDALLHLAQQWQLCPSTILYVGDYIYDLQFAQNANTLSCLVNFGETLSFADMADIEVNNLHELKQKLEREHGNSIN